MCHKDLTDLSGSPLWIGTPTLTLRKYHLNTCSGAAVRRQPTLQIVMVRGKISVLQNASDAQPSECQTLTAMLTNFPVPKKFFSNILREWWRASFLVPFVYPLYSSEYGFHRSLSPNNLLCGPRKTSLKIRNRTLDILTVV